MPPINKPRTTISAITAIGSAVTVDADDGIDPSNPSFTAAIRYYSNVAGGIIIPGAGIITVTAKGLASGQDTPIVGGDLEAADTTSYVPWKHHCTAVTATPAGVTVATHYQLVVIQED